MHKFMLMVTLTFEKDLQLVPWLVLEILTSWSMLFPEALMSSPSGRSAGLAEDSNDNDWSLTEWENWMWSFDLLNVEMSWLLLVESIVYESTEIFSELLASTKQLGRTISLAMFKSQFCTEAEDTGSWQEFDESNVENDFFRLLDSWKWNNKIFYQQDSQNLHSSSLFAL